ncbi:OmpA family protein [Qipengyuania sp. 1NDH17]|uniref:OmpA family protein n=1 Tax=Qipengyuania polymorpha TaxID=2867234 RepID=A0ABS7IWX3_9SPHN|nr:OmpA family protein [Qipengyuania polymorpha]MBX7458047.1 OmpA family protein [Qipengyuania polymorpha]
MAKSGQKYPLANCLVLVGALLSSQAANAFSCDAGPYVIFFDQNSASIGDEAREILAYAKDAAQVCKYSKVRIEGHSDTAETVEMSDKRVDRVRDLFRELGFAEEMTHAVSYGPNRLRKSTGPDVPMRENRRVEITFGPWEVPAD